MNIQNIINELRKLVPAVPKLEAGVVELLTYPSCCPEFNLSQEKAKELAAQSVVRLFRWLVTDPPTDSRINAYGLDIPELVGLQRDGEFFSGKEKFFLSFHDLYRGDGHCAMSLECRWGDGDDEYEFVSTNEVERVFMPKNTAYLRHLFPQKEAA